MIDTQSNALRWAALDTYSQPHALIALIIGKRIVIDITGWLPVP